MQTLRYAAATRLSVDIDAYNQRIFNGMRLCLLRNVGIVNVITLNLNGADCPLLGVDVVVLCKVFISASIAVKSSSVYASNRSRNALFSGTSGKRTPFR